MLFVLIVAVTVVSWAVRELLARVGEGRALVGAACTLAVLAVMPAELGRPFDSVVSGTLATALLGALPAAMFVKRWLRSGRARPRRDVADVVGLACAAAVFVLTAWCAWTTYLWDEGLTHFPVSSAIARGVLPPEHPSYPGELFRYHTGYDVLVGIVRAFSGWRPDVCCDVVTTICLWVLLGVVGHAGRALCGSSGAAFARVLVLLGYGPAAICLAGGWSMSVGCDAWFPSSWVDARSMPPAVISHFFQHPQGLGMPIGVAALLLGLERPSTARIAAAAVIVALLSQAQTVVFGLVGGGLAVGVVVDAFTTTGSGRIARMIARLVPLALAACAPAVLGGVLAGGGALGAVHLGGYFSKDAPLWWVLHNVVLFGAPLLAAPLALVRMRAGTPALRMAFIAAAVAGLVVGNAAHYERSWDIVKFFSIGCFMGNLLLADLLAALCTRGAAARAAALSIALVSTSSATVWVVRHGVLNGVIAPTYREFPVDPLALALDRAAGDVIGGRDRILTTHEEIAQAGFLVVGRDWRNGGATFLLDRARVDREHTRARAALAHMHLLDLLALDVRWVFMKEREIAALPADTEATLADHGRFERRPDVIVHGEHWCLYRVVPRSGAGAR